MTRLLPPIASAVEHDGVRVGPDGIDVRESDVEALLAEGWTYPPQPEISRTFSTQRRPRRRGDEEKSP